MTIPSLSLYDQVPSFVGVLSTHSKLLTVNQTGLGWIGMRDREEVMGCGYEDLPCKVSEEAAYFLHQDALVKKRGHIKFIGYYCYAGSDWKVIAGEKTLIDLVPEKEKGILSHFGDVTNAHLIDVARFLMNTDKKYHHLMTKKQFGYILESRYYDYQLTPKESECLFLIMRGWSVRKIAELFKLSTRTVECHLANIKTKMQCATKLQVIEKAIQEGYINIIPAGLIQPE